MILLPGQKLGDHLMTDKRALTIAHERYGKREVKYMIPFPIHGFKACTNFGL
jgi:hypothetical protein